GVSLSLYISSMAILGFGLSDLLISLYPIVVLILSRVIFKEKITSASIISIVLIVAGAVLVGIGAGGKMNTNIGIILAILGAISYGIEALVIKSIDQQNLNVGSMLFIKYLASSICLFLIILISSFIPGMLSLWNLSQVVLKLEFLFVILASLNAIASYIFYYWALQKTSNPSVIVAINSSYILFAMIISWIAKDSEPNIWNIAGTSLIFLGLIFTGITLPKYKLRKNK
ncbi:DMT family transporter, partial [Mycoplasma marinum]